MAYYFANPAAEYIRMIAADIWGDCKVYCEPHAQDISTSHLTKSSTALDYLQTQSMCNIKVVLPSTELTQEDAEAFRNAIYSQEIYRVNFGVLSLSDVVYYQELTSYVSIPSDKIEDSFYFFLLEDKSEEENMIEWSEGHEWFFSWKRCCYEKSKTNVSFGGMLLLADELFGRSIPSGQTAAIHGE